MNYPAASSGVPELALFVKSEGLCYLTKIVIDAK
jgi:hypothetical protein